MMSQKLISELKRLNHDTNLGVIEKQFLFDINSVSLGKFKRLLSKISRNDILLKCEHYLPTGSFKDQSSVTLIAGLKSNNIQEIVEDSSGNAGASLAAYTARAAISLKSFAHPLLLNKKIQIKRYGAELVTIDGLRIKSTKHFNHVTKQMLSTLRIFGIRCFYWGYKQWPMNGGTTGMARAQGSIMSCGIR